MKSAPTHSNVCIYVTYLRKKTMPVKVLSHRYFPSIDIANDDVDADKWCSEVTSSDFGKGELSCELS